MSSNELEYQVMKWYIACKTVLPFPPISPHLLFVSQEWLFHIVLKEVWLRENISMKKGVLPIATSIYDYLLTNWYGMI